MIQQWQSRYPNVFRTARFIPAVEYLTAPFALHGYAAGFPLLSEYDYHCAQYGRRTYGANMPHRQSLYHVTSWYSCCRCAPPSITIGGKLYSEATITAFANKFQQITYQQQHPPMFTK
jgi:hypothetical protein